MEDQACDGGHCIHGLRRGELYRCGLRLPLVSGVRNERHLGETVGWRHSFDRQLRADPDFERRLQEGRCCAHRLVRHTTYAQLLYLCFCPFTIFLNVYINDTQDTKRTETNTNILSRRSTLFTTYTYTYRRTKPDQRVRNRCSRTLY